MKRRFLVWLLALMMLPCYVQAEVSGIWQYHLTEDGAVLDSCIAQEEPVDLIVPAMIDGHPVIGVGAFVFSSEMIGWSLVSVTLPEGLLFLDEDAFTCSHEVQRIHLPSTLTSIPEASFLHVWAEITITPGNPYYRTENGFLIENSTETLLYVSPSAAHTPLPPVRRLGSISLDNWSFDDDPLLPDTLESIGANVFFDCPDLTQLTIPEGVIRLDDYACAVNGLEEVILPQTLQTIGANCFFETQLTALDLPDSVTWVGYSEDDFWSSIHLTGGDHAHFETEEEYYQRFPDRLFEEE